MENVFAEILMDEENKEAGHGVDLKPNEMVNIPEACPACHNNGELRLMMRQDQVFLDTLISSFICFFCDYRDKNITEMHESEVGVEVNCKFTEQEDLKRYIILGAGSEIRIVSGEHELSFSQEEDAVTVVEGMLRGVLEKLVLQNTLPETPIPNEEIDKFEEYKSTVAFLQDSLKDIGTMHVTIRDDKGVSRVLRQNETPNQNIKGRSTESFNDGAVEITQYPVERNSGEIEGEIQSSDS